MNGGGDGKPGSEILTTAFIGGGGGGAGQVFLGTNSTAAGALTDSGLISAFGGGRDFQRRWRPANLDRPQSPNLNGGTFNGLPVSSSAPESTS
jgi:hypothetical protein